MPSDLGEASTSTPSAGSPATDFPKYLRDVTSALDTLTTQAANLPDRKEIAFYRTLDRKFGKKLDVMSDKILGITEKLLALTDAGKGKARRKLEEEEDVMDGYRRGVSGVVDGLLEDADSCLDELKGEEKKAALAIPASITETAGKKKMPGPFSSMNAVPRPPVPTVFAPALIPKPQLAFPDAVDNSLDVIPYRQTLTSKPHAMVPLDFEAPLDYKLSELEQIDPILASLRRSRETRMREHPYFYEIRHLSYPTSMFTSSPPVPAGSIQDSDFVFVDTAEKLDAMVEELKQASEIAVDLEHHDTRTYRGFTCLIQISTRGKDWIVDPLALRKELRDGKLGGVMADPRIIKVFHGADSDIPWLQQDFDIFVVNLFDTYHATKVLDMATHSLAGLLTTYCGYKTDKRYQMADWRIRPMPDEMLLYARSDTHFLLSIYDHLREALLEKSKNETNPQRALRETLEHSAETALRLYEREGYDEAIGKGRMGWHFPMIKWVKGAKHLEAGLVFRRLHTWRDQVAREQDESPSWIFPNEVLKNLAMRMPIGLQAVRTILGSRAPIASTMVDQILQVINAARAEWRQKGSKALILPAIERLQSPDAVAPAQLVTSPRLDPVTETDIWRSTRSAARAGSSSIFGKTFIPAKAKTTPVTNHSALFGKTLKKAPASTGIAFDEVVRAVHADLDGGQKPAKSPSSPPSDIVATNVSALPEPETVPFVAAESRTTIPVNPEKTVVQDDGIVQVKRKRERKREIPITVEVVDLTNDVSSPAPQPDNSAKGGRIHDLPSVAGESPSSSTILPISEENISSETTFPALAKRRQRKPKVSVADEGEIPDSTAPSSALASEVLTESGRVDGLAFAQDKEHSENGESTRKAKPVKRVKRAKVNAEDIPVFDYANEPNLLDDPTKVKYGKEKKPKKEKKIKSEKPGVGTDGFGKAPVDPSQPRGGNRSRTFA